MPAPLALVLILAAVALACMLAGPLARWADHDPDFRYPGNGLFGVERRTELRVDGPKFSHDDIPPALQSDSTPRETDPVQLTLRFDVCDQTTRSA